MHSTVEQGGGRDEVLEVSLKVLHKLIYGGRKSLFPCCPAWMTFEPIENLTFGSADAQERIYLSSLC